MSEHHRSKRRDKHAQDTELPAGYEWVPINQWRLGQLEQFTHNPTQRAQTHIRPLNSGKIMGSQASLATWPRHQQSTNRANNPPPRLDAKTQWVNCTQQHALITQLEEMQERFQLVYLGLPSGAQAALRDQIEETKLAIWQFSQNIAAKKIDTRQLATRTQLAKTVQEDHLTSRLEKLKQRLLQLAANFNANKSRSEPKTFKQRAEIDNDESLWDQDCLTLGAMIESMVLALTTFAKSTPMSFCQPNAPLSAPPGSIKLRQRSQAYRAIAKEKRREKQRDATKQRQRQKQIDTRVTQGVQPTQQKDDAHFEFEHLYGQDLPESQQMPSTEDTDAELDKKHNNRH